MTIDKDGLASPARGSTVSLAERMRINAEYLEKRGSAVMQAIAKDCADAAQALSALPNTGDELVEELRELATIHGDPTNEAVLAAADAIASLTARAQAAEASLASAREALEWYADRVGGVNGWSIEGAKTRADLAEDNGRRAYAALKGVQQ